MQDNASPTEIIKKLISTVISPKVLYETKIHFLIFIDICIKICIWHFYIYLIPVDIIVSVHELNFFTFTVGAPVYPPGSCTVLYLL